MRLILALFLLVVPTLSMATPPRIVSVDEDLLAINATHVFILRTISDNHGYHQVNQTDVTLIARNRETGWDDQHWPVLSVRDNGFPTDAADPNSRVTNLGLPERVNPYDVVLWRKAYLPFSPHYVPTDLDVAFSAGRFTLRRNNALHSFELADVQAALEESFAASRKTIPIATGQISSGVAEDDFDYLFAVPVALNETCAVTALYVLPDWSDAGPNQQLIKLDCANEDRPFAVFVPMTAELSD
ncbi:hypothetical protein SAMN04488515_2176 [Cognatiyoonia koreensis]|uniref:Uncharacterized protein n=1 Tax=Cognatiyoonia koreensis TaxID=364200 RepID=A0A1I0QTY2_9RHOB|nr:hypothetical protein [Cognatiyoonia koreensis]SEW30741.1 hypothetical protein SAMN04488515_2176 [Cognatiyoonia koreensis]